MRYLEYIPSRHPFAASLHGTREFHLLYFMIRKNSLRNMLSVTDSVVWSYWKHSCHIFMSHKPELHSRWLALVETIFCNELLCRRFSN